MQQDSFAFDAFVLDAANRQLMQGGAPVALNARYFDALALLVATPGGLITKDRFIAEVWRGVPVTDEALTQCIRTLRRALGDSATVPRFIETVPKHGYRFIAPVSAAASERPAAGARLNWPHAARQGAAGTLGGGAAGALGGLFYGFAVAAAMPATGALSTGAVSTVLVLLCVTFGVALIGGAGVAFGVAASDLMNGPRWHRIIGGALGGLIVGGAVRLIGLDAIALLFGQVPHGITGAAEGALLGAGVGIGAWASNSSYSVRRNAAIAAIAGAMAGVCVTLAGGRLMGGSLDQLSQAFPAARFSLDPVAAMLGEESFGFITRLLTSALEGALFAGCIVGAMCWQAQAAAADQRAGVPRA